MTEEKDRMVPEEQEETAAQADAAAVADDTAAAPAQDQPAGLASLFLAFFKVGLFTIGGGLAMIPVLERYVVKDKHWLTEDEMLTCLAVCQALPGVIAINMATYIGNRKRGLSGSVAATIGVILPSFLIILAIVGVLGAIGDNPYLVGAMTGIKAAVCGCILAVVVRTGKRTLKDAFGWILAVLAFVCIAILDVDTALVILGAGIIGIIFHQIKLRGKGGADGDSGEVSDETPDDPASEPADEPVEEGGAA